jgi:hypothetical protein
MAEGRNSTGRAMSPKRAGRCAGRRRGARRVSGGGKVSLSRVEVLLRELGLPPKEAAQAVDQENTGDFVAPDPVGSIKLAVAALREIRDGKYGKKSRDQGVNYQKVSSREFARRLAKARAAINSLVLCGPDCFQIWKAGPLTEDELLSGLNEPAVDQFDKLLSAQRTIHEIHNLSHDNRFVAAGRADQKFYIAALELSWLHYVFVQAGIKDGTFWKFAEAAWMDAGLPDRSNKKNGENFLDWLRKYMKRNNL